jgi:class 3 adenylate cyclase
MSDRPTSARPASPLARLPRRVPLSLFLAGAIGLAMLVSLGLVLWLTLGTARENTLQLLRDKAALVLSLVEARTTQFLAPAEALTEEVAARIAQHELAISDTDALANALRYALAAAPQLSAAVFTGVDGWMVSVFRRRDGTIGWSREQWAGDRVIARAMQPLLAGDDPAPGWGEPTHIAAAGTTLMFFAHPARRDGRLVGAVVATISVPNLSRFIADIDTPGDIGTFVLYGRDRVVAHPTLAEPGPLTTADEPLPSLLAVNDPALAMMWAEGWEERRLDRFGIEAHSTVGPDGQYVYLYEPIVTSRATPWLVGGYFRAEDIGREWQQLNRATMLAGVLLLLSLVGAVLLARKLARPATQIADTARAVSALRLDNIHPMGGSRIRELDDAERSLNAMVAALGCFVRYLPRDLVDYVLRHPDRDIGRPRRRPMTIMFTDISGFTALAEALDPEAAGALLNEHFADLEACIRATGGVIDKYMGDGLLAFWGAPEPAADHPQRAVEAALAMARAVRHRNASAAKPLRLRIGIATGDILVGDLGAPTRTNYTVIGDPVNVAQRLLEMGHVAAPDHETVIVTTATCVAKIARSARPPVRALGKHQVRGRQGKVELVEVLDPTAANEPATGPAAVAG